MFRWAVGIPMGCGMRDAGGRGIETMCFGLRKDLQGWMDSNTAAGAAKKTRGGTRSGRSTGTRP